MLQTRISIAAVGVAVTVSESDELLQLVEDPGREARDRGDFSKHHRFTLYDRDSRDNYFTLKV